MQRSLIACIGLCGALAPSAALACGGLFCDGAPTSVASQTAEQIIFTHEGEKGVTIIQIRYFGNVSDFGWIVPVKQIPEKIELGTFTPFNELSRATAPRFVSPNGTTAIVNTGGPSCGGFVPSATAGSDALDGGSAAAVSTVEVIQEGAFGPFNYAVLDSESAADLYQWLNENHYNAPVAAMEIVQQYLDESSKFIALKLQPGTSAAAIQPIKITFPQFDPCIPLRLTAIASQPGLGVLVYMIGDNKAEPQTYSSLDFDYGSVTYSAASGGRSLNYQTQVASAVQDAGGHAFITEYAQKTTMLLETQTFSPETTRLLGESQYVTRLYTVLSPPDMTVDPTFSFFGAGGDVSNIHNIDTNPTPPPTRTTRPTYTSCAVASQAYVGLMLFFALRLRRPRSRGSVGTSQR